MRTDPIVPNLDAQNPAGWWVTPGNGDGTKCGGTTWQLIFPDQIGPDGNDTSESEG